MKSLLLTAAFVFSAPAAFAQTLFLDDATIVTASGAKTTTDIIYKDGVITAQRATLNVPDGAEVVSGAWVTPGLFAPMSSLGLTDIGSSGPGNDVSSEESNTNVSERATDSFNPRSVHVANIRQNGVTHALVAPRSGHGSIFAGTGAIVSLTGEFDSVLKPDAFVMINLGELGTVRAGGSRAAAMAQLRSSIEDADGFFKRFEGGPDGGDVLSRQDALAFNRATRGDIPLVVTADRASDLMQLVQLKKDNKALDIIVVGATEAWDVADALATNNIRVVIDPLHNLPDSFESAGARLDNVIFLENAGVEFAISNLSALGVTKPATLAQHAGNAVVEGLEWSQAFYAISSITAKWFGINDETVVIWDGDPLEVTSGAIAMSINGEPQTMMSRQKALRDRYNPTNTDQRPHKYR